MTEKRTSGLRTKSIDFNNESNILADKSVDATGMNMESQDDMIPSQTDDVKRFMDETDKMKKTIHKIKEIWEQENTPRNSNLQESGRFDNIYTNSEEGKKKQSRNMRIEVIDSD